MNKISNDVVIYHHDGGMTCPYIFRFEGVEKLIPIPLDAFQWNELDEDVLGGYLTLAEVRSQVIAMLGYLPVLYAWVESPLSGEIYQCGNRRENTDWVTYGTTNGYA